jgi:hypothetical protein
MRLMRGVEKEERREKKKPPPRVGSTHSTLPCTWSGQHDSSLPQHSPEQQVSVVAQQFPKRAGEEEKGSDQSGEEHHCSNWCTGRSTGGERFSCGNWAALCSPTSGVSEGLCRCGDTWSRLRPIAARAVQVGSSKDQRGGHGHHYNQEAGARHPCPSSIQMLLTQTGLLRSIDSYKGEVGPALY